MNKSELVDYVTENCSSDISKSLAGEIIDLVFQGITEELKKGGEYRMTGFGSFKISRREETQGRNPRTGETITIAASNRVKFTAGKELKEAVNE